MLHKYREHLRQWPGPHGDKDAYIKWMETTPLFKSLEGPQHQWASKQGSDRWMVEKFSSPQEVEPRSSFTSAELYDHWDKVGLGMATVRPSLTTRQFHKLLTEPA